MIFPNLAIQLSVSSAMLLVTACPAPTHYVNDSPALSLQHIPTADLATELYARSYNEEEFEPVLAARHDHIKYEFRRGTPVKTKDGKKHGTVLGPEKKPAYKRVEWKNPEKPGAVEVEDVPAKYLVEG
ncbi:hypothetical protein DACRYDRAFT_108453 [Dacryopinax primogenitus]|uniref:Uncharacterized protein n=1 Tax=Dacryopinax primogenitus (strain DJM 731) TaxID=1858805 RepID=M5FTX2_DACPD|nr:uncharacterized protein DACRYDRAFT_108453 [Dacryopinax primogenitus]EJU01121.1 hypothetical protein DACRYDRAFT_108453 [Dacryopinax primogenitus]